MEIVDHRRGWIAATNTLNPIHPGEILRAEFLEPFGRSQNARARYFGNSPEFWLGLQTDDGLEVAMDRLGRRLDQEVGLLAN